MRWKLHWRITLAYMALITALFLGAHFYLRLHLERLLEEQQQEQLDRETQILKALWEGRFAGLPFSYRMDAWTDQLAPYLQARLTVIDQGGKVWGDSELGGDALRQAENHRNRPEVREALETGMGQSIRFSATQRSRMLYVAARLEGKAKGTSPGVIRLALPLSALDRLYARVTGFLWASFAFAILLGLLFAYTLSRLLSRPILEMTAISREMTEGDFSRRAPINRGGKELAALGAALNQMSEKIGNTIREITMQKGNLEAILSSMTEGVMVVDRAERIVLMNRSLRQSLALPSPAEGRPLIEVVRHSKIEGLIRQALAQRGQVAREEIIFPGPLPRTFQVSAVTTLLEGPSFHVVGVFHDITELRRLETVRRDFVANVSHELKTPLSSIKGYAETLLDGALEDHSHARPFVQTILRQADGLTKLINDLLDLAKIESGKMEFRPLPLHLREVIPQVLETFQPLWEAKQLNMQVDAPASLPPILADEGALRQILSNLVDNAIQFTPRGGRITVSASVREGRLQVEVRDTGVGIASTDLPRIFERFFRADTARPRSSQSTGLGLAIVRHLVVAQGGEIWAESQLGMGSAFYFTLPLASVEPEIPQMS